MNRGKEDLKTTFCFSTFVGVAIAVLVVVVVVAAVIVYSYRF